jgi:dihydroorotate dehydrogenase (fumarate)
VVRGVKDAVTLPVAVKLSRTSARIALLRGRVRAALAATTGVDEPDDVAKYLLAGADVVMTASALLRHGPAYVAVLVDGLSDRMTRKGFTTVDQLRGMLSVAPGGDEAARERASYVSALRAANASDYGHR